MKDGKADILIVLVVVVLIVAAYSAYVSTRVAAALTQVDSEVQAGKRTLEGWRRWLGV
jgi:hypothetical protein